MFLPTSASEVHQLYVDEASLTGESDVIHKQTDPVDESSILQEQSNMAFMGTVTSSGRAKAVVVRVGMNTILGGIASGISDVTTPKTPLEIKLESLGRSLGYVAVTSALLLLLLHVVSVGSVIRVNQCTRLLLNNSSIAVAIFVAIVPEGLPIILVITLAMGMRRNMARQKRLSDA